MDFTAEQLRRLSRDGPEAGERWREGIERLPTIDPYLGVQDQVDHGAFRYAAGPGWYHPHFERLASDNIAWSMLLEERGEREEAEQIWSFVVQTFETDGLFRSGQASDPFYYRLRGDERTDVEPPPVGDLLRLSVQAMAARADASRCRILLRVPGDRWPRSEWTAESIDTASGDAPPDSVGELLIALATCESSAHRALADKLAQTVLQKWQKAGLAENGRLFRLAAGICAVDEARCPRVLATVRGLDLSLSHPPPLVALQHLADRKTR